MRSYLERAKELEPQLQADRRYLHQNPELADDLPVTSAYVAGRLKELDIPYRRCGKCGLLAHLGREEGPTILLRADMDALPMGEDSGLDFASPYPDKAHTCGHDTHVAMLLCAARMLKENEKDLPGRVVLMFQYGEEVGIGAREMIADGALEGVDAALALHIDATMPLNYLTAGRGPAFASNDSFDVQITGKGGHAARPADAIDPIHILAHLELAFQSLISREATPTQTNVISVTSVDAGGEHNYNIIPDTARMRGTLRTYDEGQRSLLKERMAQVVEGIARAYRGEAKLTFRDAGLEALRCDPALYEKVCRYADELFGEGYVKEPFIKVGSEDFACVAQRVPAGYFFLGAGPDEETVWPYGQHNPKVRHNETVFYRGAAVMAHCATRWLEEMGR